MAARRSGAVVAALMAVLVGLAGADFAADRAECADKLMGLATCLTYVQLAATARSPTPDCCSGFRQVLGASKKCLCVLVKDRDEPTLGIKFNVTRAMNLPSACNIPATFSDCPKILNMSPDSKEAEIFKQYGIEHEGKNATAGGAATTGKLNILLWPVNYVTIFFPPCLHLATAVVVIYPRVRRWPNNHLPRRHRRHPSLSAVSPPCPSCRLDHPARVPEPVSLCLASVNDTRRRL